MPLNWLILATQERVVDTIIATIALYQNAEDPLWLKGKHANDLTCTSISEQFNYNITI